MKGRLLLVLAVLLFPRSAVAQKPFTLEEILRGPFPENLTAANLLGYVDLQLGDATEIAAHLAGPFDCLFFDADRVSAPEQLEVLLPKLSLPTLLLADNAISHPDQIAAYLARIADLEHVSHTIIPVGKGLSVAYLSRPEPDVL